MKLLLEEAARAKGEVEQSVMRINQLRQARKDAYLSYRARMDAGQEVHHAAQKLAEAEEALRQENLVYVEKSDALRIASLNVEAAQKIIDAESRARAEPSRDQRGRDLVDDLDR